MKTVALYAVACLAALYLAACCCPSTEQLEEINRDLDKANEAVEKIEKGSKSKRKKSKRKKSKKSSPPKPATPEITVSSKKLWQDYNDNEVAADDVYKGKRILVSGKLTKIGKDFMDDIVLNLQGKNQFSSVMLNVEDSEKSKAKRLKKGSSITALCVGGGMVIGSPILRECVIK